MKRMIIHSLEVKPGSKLQFQIKLPSNINGVSGLLVTNPFTSKKLNTAYPLSSDSEVGWLWLRTTDRRDVFYSEVLRPEFYGSFNGLNEFSMSLQSNWVLSGTKRGFFSVNVATTNTIISGFYWDRFKQTGSKVPGSYIIKIYLKLF